MTKDSYRQALEDATAELDELIEKRREMDDRISKLRGIILGLSRLYNDISQDELSEMLHEPGLTDAIRSVMDAAKKPLTPPEVRDALLLDGYNLSDQSNVLSSIHSVLRRLKASGELKPITVGSKVAYERTGNYAGLIGPVLDPFAGQGSMPVILANPPYVAEKKRSKK